MIILRSPCGLSLLLEVPVWDEIVDDGIFAVGLQRKNPES